MRFKKAHLAVRTISIAINIMFATRVAKLTGWRYIWSIPCILDDVTNIRSDARDSWWTGKRSISNMSTESLTKIQFSKNQTTYVDIHQIWQEMKIHWKYPRNLFQFSPKISSKIVFFAFNYLKRDSTWLLQSHHIPRYSKYSFAWCHNIKICFKLDIFGKRRNHDIIFPEARGDLNVGRN